MCDNAYEGIKVISDSEQCQSLTVPVFSVCVSRKFLLTLTTDTEC